MAIAAHIKWLPGRRASAAGAERLAFDPAAFAPALRTRLLILQPTPFCNIDCDYCYLPDRANTARMSLATVHQAAARLRQDGLAGPTLTVVWHAGEPLTMPSTWFDEAIDAVADALGPATEVTHAIQTNATLIDDAWCALIRRRGIRIGVSVDGPAALHDAHRRTRDGRGTHARVLRGMARLREHGIAFHAIAVVTPATFAQADAFADFFEAQGVTEVGCNFDEAEGPHAASSLAGQEDAHAAFLQRLLERTGHSGSRLRVRELELARQAVLEPMPRMTWRGRPWPDNAQVTPFAIVTVAHDGTYSTFSPELLGQPSREFGDFALGRVADAGYLESASSERFERLWAAVERGVRHCGRHCAHFGHCGGGAPANKLYENGDLGGGETLYCRTMVQRPFEAVLARLEHEVAARPVRRAVR